MKKVDVAIIGAGTSGLSARRQVAKKTDNYVVIDDGPLGTTCARVGCMPSKVLIQVANDFHRRHKLAEQGISGGENLKLDVKEAFKHVRKLRDRFVRGVTSGIEDWRDNHLIRARAKFVKRNILQLSNGETIEAKKIIVATGSSPMIPRSWNAFSDFFITTDQFFEQENPPQKVAVIGLGVIGLELGQAMNRLGIEVIGITRSKRMGGLTDPEVVEYSFNKIAEEMKIDITGVEKLERTSDNKLKISTAQDTYVVDQAMVAVGRAPNLKSLDLENINVERNGDGIPLYNHQTGQIANTSIYIAGDITAERTILHEAADEGNIAGYNAVAEHHQAFERRTPLYITFSEPNIAVVGLSHQQLTDTGIDFAVGRVTFEGQGRSIVKLKEMGLLNIYGNKKTGEILGAELFGPDAEHIAHMLAWVIQLKVNIHQSLSLPFYHPVVQEGLRTALRDLSRQCEGHKSPIELIEIN